jgi:hypothetical protein
LTKRGGVTTAGILLGLIALMAAQAAVTAALSHLGTPGLLIDIAEVMCLLFVVTALAGWAGRRHPRLGKVLRITERANPAITDDAPK